jgi:murein DD-endopeptidase MepM/ murein hydrolase activator NlpD
MKRTASTKIGIAVLALLLSICPWAIVSGVSAAENGAWPPPTFYTVVARPGDSLASVAARYEVPVASVAKLNRISIHSRVAAGQVLRIPAGLPGTREAVLAEALDRTAPNYAPPPKSFGTVGSVRTPHMETPVPGRSANVDAQVADANDDVPSRRFAWPVRGPVISAFGPGADGERNDGVNIAAMLGAPIHAAAAGTVTYAGDALKDYGNLILIAHPGGYITAYAHAQNLMVARGDRVEKGQIIGTAGESGGVDRPQLHFEIREGGKPVDPLRLLASLP